MPRVCILGLDGLEPALALGTLAAHMPRLQELAERGTATRLRSCFPPITVPAWACMMTGRDPGELGLYGFRERSSTNAYGAHRLASSLSVRAPTLASLASRAGHRVRVIGVPPAYPPKPVLGSLVSCFLTPAGARPFTYPAELADEVEQLTGPYPFDVTSFRRDDEQKTALVDELEDGLERRARLAHDWIRRADWQLFQWVDMTSDRLHHACLRYLDPRHPRHDPEHPLAARSLRLIERIDDHMGTLLGSLRPDDLALVVSDHGAIPRTGGFALNDWLVQRGDLVLRRPPTRPTRLEECDVDWARTRAFAEGGYVGRLFVNLAGRDPQGLVAPHALDATLDELRRALGDLRTSRGTPLATDVHRPRELYHALEGRPPDLFVGLDGLGVRALGTVGHDTLTPEANDTGPDDANHGQEGVLFANRPLALADDEVPTLYDITPTVLTALGLEVPSSLRGRDLLRAR